MRDHVVRTIGEAAAATGLPVKTIRYYESIGLITPGRRASGYREFTGGDIDRLRFVARARSLGFPVEDCRRLLDLYAAPTPARPDVRGLAADHIAALDRKMAELSAMRATLAELVTACEKGNSDDCPILASLAK
jgi:Cu(I)-responsive transcriptional regulator